MKAVIFDWFGVMTPASMTDTAQQIARNHGVLVEDVRQVFKDVSVGYKTGKISEDEFWEEMSRGVGKEITAPRKSNVWASNEQCRPTPEMVSLVKSLSSRGYKTALLSNTFPHTASYIREQGWYDIFDVAITSSECGVAKPDPAVFELCLNELNTAPADALFIDDQQKNIHSANQLGLQALLIEQTDKAPRLISDFLQSST